MSADQMASTDQKRDAGRRLGASPATPLLLGLAVLAAALIGILLRPVGHLSSFWAANAVMLGLLVRNPRLSTPLGWAAAAAGFILADTLTGSGLNRALMLTAANLTGVLVGYLLFKRLTLADRLLLGPSSLLTVTLIAVAASVATSMFGATSNALLYHRPPLTGFFIWLATELANYIVILPVALTFPGLAGLRAWLSKLRAEPPRLGSIAPLLAYLVSLAMVLIVGGPGALAFPVPALLWCAVAYSVAVTTLLTLSFAIWTLVVLSAALAGMGVTSLMGFDLMSLRLGVMLVALGPITVASVMASRNASLREARLARKAAEEAMAARTLLLATMAHELRSPLTAVVGFSSIMARQALGPVGNPKYLDYAQSIEMAGSHLADLVSDLLDTARVESGKFELTPAPVSSLDLVEQSMRLVRGLAVDADVRMAVEPGSWSVVHVDPRAIKQVLINLLTNAVKFSPAGAPITISATLDADRLVVRVKDFGPGIREEDLAVLGRPYAQVGDEASRRQGWGLGLALSGDLIAMHGGRLRLESSFGVGTTAIFDLPLATPLADALAG